MISTPAPAIPNGLDRSRIVFSVQALNCTPWDWCTDAPVLHFMARELLPGSQIVQVTLSIGGHEKRYEGADAVLPLPETNELGDWIGYSALSDHPSGQSANFRLKYRYVRSAAQPGSFRFDILGTDWADEAPAGSMIWGMFPPLVHPLPKALDQPLSVDYLFTTNRYMFLAGHLIQSGMVDGSACPNNGLYDNGAATECGESAGAAAALAWQNKYDAQIYSASLKYNIPARILKGIVAQESQFWPASGNPYELGLGNFTENGAGMTLMWNVEYFLTACQPVYGEDACASGYSHLNPAAQLMVRRVLIDRIGTDFEIDLLAAALLASAAQVNQLVLNTSGREPSELTGYVDMWEISTANYYAGSGCIGGALQKVNDGGQPLSWETLITQMNGECKLAGEYVQKVFDAAQ